MCGFFIDGEIILPSPKKREKKEGEIQPIIWHNTTQTEIPIYSIVIMSSYLYARHTAF